ncbi:MAG: hypothetical protein OXF79_12240 [Chloroflexi bacterium]|nr:hypothetical protein [Chloroflexota bacterium]
MVCKNAASALCGILDLRPRCTGHGSISSLCPVTKYELADIAGIRPEIVLRPLQDSRVRGRLFPAEPPIVHQPPDVSVHWKRFQFIERHQGNTVRNFRTDSVGNFTTVPSSLHQTLYDDWITPWLHPVKIQLAIMNPLCSAEYCRWEVTGKSARELQLNQSLKLDFQYPLWWWEWASLVVAQIHRLTAQRGNLRHTLPDIGDFVTS